MPVETFISVDMMIIEAGIVINSLSSKEGGRNLAARIMEQAHDAWQQQDTHCEVPFDPIEVGMVLDALSRSQQNVTGDLIQRIYTKTNEKMAELGVAPISDLPGGTVGSDEGPVGEDLSGTVTDAPAADEPAAQPSSEPVAPEGDAVDNDSSAGETPEADASAEDEVSAD